MAKIIIRTTFNDGTKEDLVFDDSAPDVQICLCSCGQNPCTKCGGSHHAEDPK